VGPGLLYLFSHRKWQYNFDHKVSSVGHHSDQAPLVLWTEKVVNFPAFTTGTVFWFMTYLHKPAHSNSNWGSIPVESG
jgi:hypothetical protein